MRRYLALTQVPVAHLMLPCDTSSRHKAPTIRFGPIQFNPIRSDLAGADPIRSKPIRFNSSHPSPIQSAHTHILQDTTKAHTYTTICLTITTWRPPPASSCLLVLTEHLAACLSAYSLAYLRAGPSGKLAHARLACCSLRGKLSEHRLARAAGELACQPFSNALC